MGFDLAHLPDDAASLKRIVAELAAANDALAKETRLNALAIEQLKAQIARLKRMQFGKSSERIEREIDQLELQLDDLQQEAAISEAKRPEPLRSEPERPYRKPLPDSLPREDEVHQPACACPDCGAEMKTLGEDVTEVLEYVPGSFKVIRHIRPKLACRACDKIVQMPMPFLPIARGRPGPGLLAHVLVSKYADHLPLYRQQQIFARAGIALARSTLADWVGQAAASLEPLVAALRKDVLASDVLHGDDTPVPVLAPGAGKTKTGRVWAYVRDGRSHGSEQAPAAVYFYSADRKGEHPQAHLKSFKGVLHADGYAGFNAIFERSDVSEAACWAHVRRKFFDIHAANCSPIAREALDRVGALYAIEESIRTKPPDERQRWRAEHSGPLVGNMKAWIEATLPKLSGKTELAQAMRYTQSRWSALSRFLEDGRIEIDNNPAERAIRGIALGRKNWLFAGSDSGGETATVIYSLIETAKLNGLDPQAYLHSVIDQIADHPINRIADLLPWNWARSQPPAQAA